jgi:trimethylamine--corrinoid protein Co-methyltransferase
LSRDATSCWRKRVRTSYRTNATVQFRVLSDGELEEVFSACLAVLERTGVKVLCEEAAALLAEAGAEVGDDDVVRIPSHLVKRALATAPSHIHVYDRNGRPAMALEDGKVYYGPGPTCPNLLDARTGERRPFVKQDGADTARLCDALENIDFAMSLGAISDVRASLADVHEFDAMVRETTKPIITWSFGLNQLKDIYEMCKAVAGGERKFGRRPFAIFYAEPASPLIHPREALEKLLFCAEQRIPLIYTPCALAGATATATLAGVLATAAAESLSGLVVHQLKRAGAPFVMGGVVSVMDMTHGVLAYGAPELALLSAAYAELARHVGIPMFSTGGCTDAKTVDQQAAVEGALSLLMAGLSGANLVHDVGYIEGAMTGSHEMLVMCDEVLGMVKHMVRGMRVDEEHLGLEVIEKVGPMGQFVGEEHTRRHFREEFWRPRLISRHRHHVWEREGRPDMGARVRARTLELLDTHRAEPLPAEVRAKLDEIAARAEAREAAAGS